MKRWINEKDYDQKHANPNGDNDGKFPETPTD